MNRLKAVLGIAVLICPAVSWAGPFGLQEGMSLEQLQQMTTLKQVSTYVYQADHLPQGHEKLDDYHLLVTPQHGLCKVVAWTPSIDTNVHGSEIRQRFSGWHEALAQKYGASKDFDFLIPGSIWNEPEDWTMGLLKKERNLASFWDSDSGSDLPDDLYTIALQAVAVHPNVGLISIGYEFSNMPACSDFIKHAQNSSL